jgi:uncharacterized Zn finger protein (UPF0148 family)
MTEKYEECPNGCSSAGEVWNGEGLVLCPICKGNTTVAKEMIDAPDRLWVDPTGVDELDMYIAHASDTMDYLNMDISYTRDDIGHAQRAALETQISRLVLVIETMKAEAARKPHSRGLNPRVKAIKNA